MSLSCSFPVAFLSLPYSAGVADGKRDPRRWKLQDGAQFIGFLTGTLNVPLRDIYQAAKGKGGGSFAHWQIALAYAKYLSPALHMEVNEVYSRFKAGDVTLADEIADKASPADQEWLAKRVAGKAARGQQTNFMRPRRARKGLA